MAFSRHGWTWSCRPPCGGVDRNDYEGTGDWIRVTSPSVRGRGSKRANHIRPRSLRRRPPCGGVDRNAYSYSGAYTASESPSVRGRGSKRLIPRLAASPDIVALRAGAWIETDHPGIGQLCRDGSPSVRGRGSKPQAENRQNSLSRRPPCGGVDRNQDESGLNPGIKSPSVRGRGSKRSLDGGGCHQGDVALRAGAWIETSRCAQRS